MMRDQRVVHVGSGSNRSVRDTPQALFRHDINNGGQQRVTAVPIGQPG
ncbi:hypothetical protein GCM10027562_28150 [Arthrobacter pigmenti]